MADNSDDGDGDGDQGPPPDVPAEGSPDNVVQGPWWPEGECPSALLFAEYLDDRLPESQRARIYDHLSDCSRCRHDRTLVMALLLEIAALDSEDLARAKDVAQSSLRVLAGPWAETARPNDHGDDDGQGSDSRTPQEAAVVPPAWRHPVARHAAAIALTAACIAALVGVGTGFLPGLRSTLRSAPPDSFVMVPRERPFAARFTGKFPWAPATTRSGDPTGEYDRYLPREAVAYLMAAERRGRPPEAPTASMLGMVGASQVLTGRVEPGVETLRRASAAQPRSAELLSDLGAALLARAEAGESSPRTGQAPDYHDADYPAALEAFDRAIEISPRLGEPLFNRALALERLHLPFSARKAWQAYLSVDNRSRWADEARRRLAAITTPDRPDALHIRNEIVEAATNGESDRLGELVLAHRHLARLAVQNELLPGWASAWLSGNVEKANRQLRAASAISDEWEAETGDSSLREAVTEVENAGVSSADNLAAGYRDFGTATQALAALDIATAQAVGERALRSLPRTSPAFTWTALIGLSCAAYRNADIETDARQLADHAQRDLSSVGRAYWIIGLQLTNRGDPATALPAYGRSLAAFEQLGELDSVVWLHFLMGDAYARMGASAPAWSYHRSALLRVAELSESLRAQSILVATATLALFEGRDHVAVDVLDEVLAQADPAEAGPPAQAYLWRSRVLYELGRFGEASRDLDDARIWLSRARPFQRQLLSGDFNLVAGLLTADPHDAVDRISKALARFHEFGPAWRVPGILLARAEAQLKAGNAQAADADLRRGLDMLQRQVGGATGEALWTRRFDGPEDLINDRVELALRRGRVGEALGLAEAGRETILRKVATTSSRLVTAQAGSASEILQHLEPGTTLLYYSWLPERVVLWQLQRGHSEFFELTTKPEQLSALIHALVTDLNAGAWNATTQTTAARLYAAVLPTRVGAGPLAIVPDGDLYRLPFAALIDHRRGRFLVEDHELTVAPSATDFLENRSRRAVPNTLDEALVVGDPRVNDLLLPWMQPLEGARREARAVAGLYPRRELLVGRSATRSAVLAALGRRPIVHFAGHAILNDANPAQSSLALADSTNGVEGLLTASEIATLDLTTTRTVVLSGCDTGVGEDGGGEGPLSLARAFRAAGAQNVVASLWPIVDAPSVALMTAFHRRLRVGESPSTALRGAQLELLRSQEPTLRAPGVWAAFESFGG